MREIGVALRLYADVSGDLPPTFFAPVGAVYPPATPEKVRVRSLPVSGFWFDHTFRYHLALAPSLPASVLMANAKPADSSVLVDGAASVAIPDFRLPKCLYTAPEYWDRATQRGPVQWAAQKFADITYPSAKGIVYQAISHDQSRHPHQDLTRTAGARGSVLWADHSGTTTVISALSEPVPDRFDHYVPADIVDLIPATPISQTHMGIRGRDR